MPATRTRHGWAGQADVGPRRVLAPHTTPGVKGAAGGGGAQEQFWRENIARFEEKDFQALKQLLKVVGGSSDPGTLAVACHDLGCFIHHFPAGKGIVTGGAPPQPTPAYPTLPSRGTYLSLELARSPSSASIAL